MPGTGSSPRSCGGTFVTSGGEPDAQPGGGFSRGSSRGDSIAASVERNMWSVGLALLLHRRAAPFAPLD